MGHLIPGDGLKPDPEKVAAIMKIQNPTDIKSMQWFIGFVNYLPKFLPNLTKICEPLQNYHEKMHLGHGNQNKKQHLKKQNNSLQQHLHFSYMVLPKK